MKKNFCFSCFLCAVLTIFLLNGPAETVESQYDGDHIACFLIGITKAPLEIRLRTGSGEKNFPWTQGTVFLDAAEKELDPATFLIRFKDHGVKLLFDKQEKVTTLSPAVF